MNEENLRIFIFESLDEAVMQRKKASYSKQGYFDGYIQAMEELKEYLDENE